MGIVQSTAAAFVIEIQCIVFAPIAVPADERRR